MNSKKPDTPPKRHSLAIYAIVALAAALAGFGAVYVNYGASGNGGQVSEVKPSPPSAGPAPAQGTGGGDLASYARGDMTTFVAKETPKALPEVSFNDGEGKPRTIADWKGRVVLLNLWATWCAPCREEMPSLDALQAALGGEAFEVVTVSIDKSDDAKPRKFLEKIGVKNLGFYHDPTSKAGTTLSAYGMPTTLLIDRDGREIGRVVGPAKWDSPDAAALLKSVIGEDGKNPA